MGKLMRIFFFCLISNLDNVACPLKVSGVLTVW